jgi:hypothetical protein
MISSRSNEKASCTSQGCKLATTTCPKKETYYFELRMFFSLIRSAFRRNDY